MFKKMRINRVNFVALFILGIFVISFANAGFDFTTPDKTSFSSTLKQGDTNKLIGTLVINGQADSAGGTLNINLGNVQNDLPSGLTLSASPSSLVILPNQTFSESISLYATASSTLTPSTYTPNGKLFIGSNPVSFSFIVEQNTAGKCRIYTLPIPLSKTLEYGVTAFQIIDVYVSKYCASPLDIRTNSPQMTKPISFAQSSGSVEPSNKFSIQVDYDSRGVQNGVYSDNLIITGLDEDENEYTLTLPISLTITNTISPISNGSFQNLPSCSVSGSDLALNQSYKLVCNDIPPNIEVMPIVDTNYIKGLSVEETQNTYTYNFKPASIGNTVITARFLYKNAPIGTDFNQNIRILSTGNIQSGTVMQFKFYPELYDAKTGQEIIVRVIDNNSQNILNDAKILLNGADVKNNSLKLETGKTYELRASNFGYADIVSTIDINPKLLVPTGLQDSYLVGDSMNFSTTPNYEKIYLDSVEITLPYALSTEGTKLLSINKAGYTEFLKNISVVNSLRVVYSTPFDQQKKGGSVSFEVERPTNLSVTYQENNSAQSVQVTATDLKSNSIKFDTKKTGIYTIYGDNKPLQSFIIKDSNIWKKWWMILVYIVLVVIGILFFLGRGSKTQQPKFLMEAK